MVAKIATLHHIDDKEEVLAVLESIVHVYKETKQNEQKFDLRMVKLTQKLFLVHDRMH